MSRRQRVVPKSPDAFEECNVISRFILNLVISDWDITPPEDVFVRRGLKARIQNAIVKVIDSVLDTDSSTDEERSEEAEEEEETHNDTFDSEYTDTNDDDNNNTAFVPSPASRIRYRSDSRDNAARPCDNLKTRPAARRNCIPNMLFPLETYRLLNDCGWLPESHHSFRLVYELHQNHLIVHMASPAHDAVANAWNIRIALWSTNGGTGVENLRQLGQERMTCLSCQLTIPEYRWTADSEKSPDQSFVPMNIASPPALIIPRTIAGAFPTMVMEVSKTHESYNNLFDDAVVKHFSTQTSVRVWIGVKLNSGHGGRLRCMFRLRDPVNGGILANSGATTEYISLHQPTDIEFIIPKLEVFWGVNPPLPPTQSTVPGPNALPKPQVPGTPTDDLVLPVEQLRNAALAYW